MVRLAVGTTSVGKTVTFHDVFCPLTRHANPPLDHINEHNSGRTQMTRFRIIKTTDRRGNRSDRRRPADRRSIPGIATRKAMTVRTLRELLDEAHGRIRNLERELRLRTTKLP
jgi:hypothetical protein